MPTTVVNLPQPDFSPLAAMIMANRQTRADQSALERDRVMQFMSQGQQNQNNDQSAELLATILPAMMQMAGLNEARAARAEERQFQNRIVDEQFLANAVTSVANQGQMAITQGLLEAKAPLEVKAQDDIAQFGLGVQQAEDDLAVLNDLSEKIDFTALTARDIEKIATVVNPLLKKVEGRINDAGEGNTDAVRTGYVTSIGSVMRGIHAKVSNAVEQGWFGSETPVGSEYAAKLGETLGRLEGSGYYDRGFQHTVQRDLEMGLQSLQEQARNQFGMVQQTLNAGRQGGNSSQLYSAFESVRPNLGKFTLPSKQTATAKSFVGPPSEERKKLSFAMPDMAVQTSSPDYSNRALIPRLTGRATAAGETVLQAGKEAGEFVSQGLTGTREEESDLLAFLLSKALDTQAAMKGVLPAMMSPVVLGMPQFGGGGQYVPPSAQDMLSEQDRMMMEILEMSGR